MNLAEAKDILKNRAQWKIEKIPNRSKSQKRWKVILGYTEIEYTDRELIKHAGYFTSENKQNTKISSNVKYFSKKKNRRATRDKINQGEFDDIPQNGPMLEDNPWNWDQN